MPRLVIVNQAEGLRVYDIEQTNTVMGRGEDADLILPNISVSRHHAQISWDGQTAALSDLKSSNGTMVNGERVDSATLKSGDEIVLGKFTMVFMGDGADNRFYKGRYLEYMVKYNTEARSFDDSTFAMSPAQLQKMQEEAHTMRNARLILITNSNRYWHPEDQTLTFGDGGMVRIEGLFTGGVVADVTWNGKHHVIQKHARMTKVVVNEESVTTRPLRNGDRVRIGNTGFRYEVTNG